MDETAIPIDRTAFATVLPQTQEEEEMSDVDKAIAGLMSVPSWKVYEDFVQARLDNLKASIDTSNLSLEQIGQQYVVISKVVDEINAILFNIRTQTEAVLANEERERDDK